MEILREGSSGGDVTALQLQLRAQGFPPGAIDGNFGPGTTAAVVAFQRSEGLVSDGVVGVRTAQALGVAAADLPPPPAMPNVTVAVVAKMFPVTPLGHINANLPHVLAALVAADLTAVPIVLAALATIRAETEGFLPISEGLSRFNSSPGGHPFDLYDNRKDLGNKGPPDGDSFKGRGFVQLTGRANYAKFGPLVGVENLVDAPDQANDPDVAARLLAAFIDAKKAALATALAGGDLAAARRLVNGGSNGLDRFTSAYQIGAGLLAIA
ncbi:MAG: Phage endolysin [Rhodospirillales bacterium]|jgi:putative chitinase|nr:Phage endolysin [Rhodospirillales bacterium]